MKNGYIFTHKHRPTHLAGRKSYTESQFRWSLLCALIPLYQRCGAVAKTTSYRRCFYCCCLRVYICARNRYIISVDTVVLVYTRSLPICENFKVVFSLHRLFGGHTTTYNRKHGLFGWARVRILNVCILSSAYFYIWFTFALMCDCDVQDMRILALLGRAIVTHTIYRRSAKWRAHIKI